MNKILTATALLLSVTTANAASPKVLLQQWYVQNDHCRDAELQFPGSCEKREALGKRLEVAGLKYGYSGWMGACNEWHPATTPKPNRPECEAE